ncbi:MAG: hypothetical protein J5767_01065 [Paludibacteraceae bacterium]|nr:hypothetical protein [Paludibacteraceae bacterium]
MSLDTVLKIGKVLKNSKNSLKHFKYVSSPRNKDGYPLCIVIPIKNDYTFNFDEIDIIPENERENLYYLRYKTSDSDSSPAKYVYGDILYKIDRRFDKKGKIKDAKESGNYVIFKKNAFENAEDVRKSYIKYFIETNAQNKSKKEQNQLIESVQKYISDGKTNEFITSLLQMFPIIAFWRSFYENKDKIEKILRFAPVYEKSREVGDIEDEYIKYLFEYKLKDINKIIGTKRNDELSDEEKNLLLKYAEHEVFIHFKFDNNEQWYTHSAFQLITKMLNREISSIQNGNMIVPTKSIYRTLCSGNGKNDIQFPDFCFDNSYKSFGFTCEQFEDFMYANSVLSIPRIWLKGTDINIFVYPAKYEEGAIDAEKYESFFFDKKSESSLFDFDFLNFEGDDGESNIRFDFVFSNTGGNTTIDLIEISGIEKSQLKNIKERISGKESDVSKKMEDELGRSNYYLNVEKSFSNILGTPSIEQGKVVLKNQVKKNGKLAPYAPYQSHMLKVLPLIYTENYYQDKTLLTNVIEKIEFSIRNGEEYGNYNLLKYSLYLICSIQNNDKYNNFMEITESSSYKFGLKLGKLAKPLKKEINSFEKTYVGLLTRRIPTKEDCVKFVNDICGKLTMHEKAWGTMCADVCRDLANLSLKDYDKEKVSFGFFEGYFRYEPNDKRKDFQSRLEKILADYEGNEDFFDEIEKIKELTEELNNKL